MSKVFTDIAGVSLDGNLSGTLDYGEDLDYDSYYATCPNCGRLMRAESTTCNQCQFDEREGVWLNDKDAIRERPHRYVDPLAYIQHIREDIKRRKCINGESV